eukprot:COSAG06_NODE_10801_length_1613_cov_8.605020_1_plen_278_part_10
MMHLRKWLRILINRSLVLGTIDRPSVHDLVLDFTVAQHTDDQLREGHRRVVEAFRASRPEDVHGRRKYDSAGGNRDSIARFVCAEALHHVSNAGLDRSSSVEWLRDVPQDELVLFAAISLGNEELFSIAAEAEKAEDWWLAARYWSIVRELTFQHSGQGAASTYAQKCLVAIEHMSDGSDVEARDDLRLVQYSCIAQAFDLPTLCQRLDDFEATLSTQAALRAPSTAFSMGMLLNVAYLASPEWTGDMTRLCNKVKEVNTIVRTAAKSDPDPHERFK